MSDLSAAFFCFHGTSAGPRLPCGSWTDGPMVSPVCGGSMDKPAGRAADRGNKYKREVKNYMGERKNPKLKTASGGFLGAVERIGNRMPHPNYIFMILTVFIVIVSGLAAGSAVIHPGTGEEVVVRSLANADGLRWFLTSVTKNFINFAPLGNVIVCMIGIGIADEAGLLGSALRHVMVGAPKTVATAIIIFAGVMGNMAGSATFVIIPPLAAIIFKAMGRHPIAGVAAGFAGVAAGLNANLLITTTDITLSGITTNAAQIVAPDFAENQAGNWYFMIASTVLLTVVGTVVLEKLVEPRLGRYDASSAADSEEDVKREAELMHLTDGQRKGLKMALITLIVYVVLLMICVVPFNGILRDPVSHTIVPSPFINGMVAIITIGFAAVGIAYGIPAGTIKKSDDVIRMATKSMNGFSGFIILCFFAAQFCEVFAYTNLGMWLSVKGADALAQAGFTGIPLIICFVILASLINFLIGSASAKWTLLAPIFVPMFMNPSIGFHPYYTQSAYRIADSVTNCVSPLEPFMPYIISLMQKYDKKAGLGTVVSVMLPIAGAFWLSWVLLLVIWSIAKLPLGPGVGIMF